MPCAINSLAIMHHMARPAAGSCCCSTVHMLWPPWRPCCHGCGYGVFDSVLRQQLALEPYRIAKPVMECHVWCMIVAGKVWVDRVGNIRNCYFDINFRRQQPIPGVVRCCSGAT
jgi:hypothetical protein